MSLLWKLRHGKNVPENFPKFISQEQHTVLEFLPEAPIVSILT